MVRAGACYRVGNGSSILILDEPWLPSPSSPGIISHHSALVNRKVANLMQINHHSWDSNLVRDLFNPRDSAKILSIPLNPSCSEDH